MRGRDVIRDDSIEQCKNTMIKPKYLPRLSPPPVVRVQPPSSAMKIPDHNEEIVLS